MNRHDLQSYLNYFPSTHPYADGLIVYDKKAKAWAVELSDKLIDLGNDNEAQQFLSNLLTPFDSAALAKVIKQIFAQFAKQMNTSIKLELFPANKSVAGRLAWGGAVIALNYQLGLTFDQLKQQIRADFLSCLDIK